MMLQEDNVVKIVEYRKIDAEGCAIVEGFPDVGLVGSIAVAHMIENLQMEEVGSIESELLPPIVAVKSSKVRDLIRLYQKDNILAIFSEIPIPINLIKPISELLISWASKKKSKYIISISGLPEPTRIDIETPEVFVVSSIDMVSEDLLRSLGASPFANGYLAGIKAAILKEGVRMRYPVMLVLAQAHLNYPDPGAAASALSFLSKLLKVEIDVTPLLQSAEEIKIRMRDLMRRTAETMGSMQKSKELELPPVYM